MKSESARTLWRLGMAALTVVGLSACATSAGQQSARPGASAIDAQMAGGKQRPNIEHVQPARDSVGAVPASLVWTAVPGADSYSIGIWNEVDRLVWRQDGITGTSTPGPSKTDLEPGTYFWTISAVQGGQEIAQSGLAAFVVRATP